MQYREERNPQLKSLRSALEQWTEIGSRWYVCEAKGSGVRQRVVVASGSTRALGGLQVIKRCLVVPARWLYCIVLNSGLVLLHRRWFWHRDEVGSSSRLVGIPLLFLLPEEGLFPALDILAGGDTAMVASVGIYSGANSVGE